tara:strand:+ start:6864 stop:7064 length:201 start_codon:yes stop_codon:yes gene_type:complete
MRPFPNKLQGNKGLTNWLNQLLEACKSREIKSGHKVLIKEQSGGIVIEPKSKTVSSGGGSGLPVWF